MMLALVTTAWSFGSLASILCLSKYMNRKAKNAYNVD